MGRSFNFLNCTNFHIQIHLIIENCTKPLMKRIFRFFFNFPTSWTFSSYAMRWHEWEVTEIWWICYDFTFSSELFFLLFNSVAIAIWERDTMCVEFYRGWSWKPHELTEQSEHFLVQSTNVVISDEKLRWNENFIRYVKRWRKCTNVSICKRQFIIT